MAEDFIVAFSLLAYAAAILYIRWHVGTYGTGGSETGKSPQVHSPARPPDPQKSPSEASRDRPPPVGRHDGRVSAD